MCVYASLQKTKKKNVFLFSRNKNFEFRCVCVFSAPEKISVFSPCASCACVFFVVQDQPRPPVYNVEDYAGALRRFGKRGPTADGNNGGGGSSETKHTEMTLKEFTSATELLDKLKADLKLAYFRYLTHSQMLIYLYF